MNLVRVEKVDSYSGAEVRGVGMVNSFLAGNDLFLESDKKNVEQNQR